MAKPTSQQGQFSRRSLLKSAPLVAGAVASLGVAGKINTARAQTKLTHAVAKYQDSPHGSQQCSNCVNFEPPGSCKIVQDPISPNGWCQFYGPKS